MSHIEQIDLQVANLKQEQQDIAAKYDSYATVVREQLQALLIEHGIFDQFAELEMARETRRASDQTNITELAKRLDALLKYREFLMAQEALSQGVSETSTVPVDAVVDVTDADTVHVSEGLTTP